VRVQVYFNLHKKTYSIRSKKTRKVVGYSDNISLENIEFKVSESGRKRVLKEQRKNVHAVIEGDLVAHITLNKGMRGVTYNPYKYDSFVVKKSLEPIFEANTAYLWVTNNRIPKVVVK
jgi:hypothetical protein